MSTPQDPTPPTDTPMEPESISSEQKPVEQKKTTAAKKKRKSAPLTGPKKKRKAATTAASKKKGGKKAKTEEGEAVTTEEGTEALMAGESAAIETSEAAAVTPKKAAVDIEMSVSELMKAPLTEQTAPLKGTEQSPQAASSEHGFPPKDQTAMQGATPTDKLEDKAIAGVGSGVPGTEATSEAAGGGASNIATTDVSKKTSVGAQHSAGGEKKDSETAAS